MSAGAPHGTRILIVDDEAPIRRFLRVALEAEGYVVAEAATAREGIDLTALDKPALMILDLGLPDADGRTVLAEVRRWSDVPVLVLSVRSSEPEKVALLDAGAQDYVVKPFGTRELLARIRSLLRDHAALHEAPGAVVGIGGLTIDAAAHTVALDGRPVRLTRKEFDLLWMLAANAGRLVTQGMILRTIWGRSHEADKQYLRVFIGQLRAKLGDDATNPRYIFTEPGVGYRFSER